MAELRFKIDPKIFKEFSHILEKAKDSVNKGFNILFNQTNSKVGLYQNPIPSPEQLEQLIEVAFWTSIEREEGRSLQFNLSYVNKVPTELSYLLKSPEPYTVERLVKLAPVANSKDQTIIVSPSGNGQLEISGIKIYRDRVMGITPITIKVLSPGKLILEFCTLNLAFISGHQVSHIFQPMLMKNAPFWKILKEKIEEPIGLLFAENKQTTIVNVLSEMRAMQHGGALIIVPDDWEKNEEIAIPFVVRDNDQEKIGILSEKLYELSDEMVKNSNSDRVNSLFNSLKFYEKSLANLTAVDGAVLINSNLKILGYGCKLDSKESDNLIFKTTPLKEEGDEAKVELKELGGTRHQSVAKFVMSQNSATAFVVSQDGNISAFIWNDKEGEQGNLLVYKNLELTFY